MLIAFGTMLLVAEGACRWAITTGFLYSHMNPVVEVTSRPEVLDRLHWGASQKNPLYLFGDSVLGPTAMTQKRIPGARRFTLSRQVDLLAESNGACAVNLGSDGLLLPDIEALSQYLEKGKPQSVLLLLNFRMFAPEFESGKTAYSRPFLSLRNPPPDSASRAESFLLRHWVLFRVTRLLRTLWYEPSQKDFFQRILENTLHLESDPDIQQAALVMKAASFYPSKSWDPQGAPLQSLDRVLQNLSRLHIPITVVLTPQNPTFLGKRFDRSSFTANRLTLRKLLQKHLGPDLQYLDWADRYPSQTFLDHCHLTPDGNAQLARDLWSVLKIKPTPETSHE
jgi:hypothetical protein